jgi:hypothetical protein
VWGGACSCGPFGAACPNQLMCGLSEIELVRSNLLGLGSRLNCPTPLLSWFLNQSLHATGHYIMPVEYLHLQGMEILDLGLYLLMPLATTPPLQAPATC